VPFLPIVERELRVTARRRGTHWVRLLVALGAILTGIVVFLANLGKPPHLLGQNIFAGLSMLCMVNCVLSGRTWTADCLSEEKREGTLGLLFLTDLKGYDIVLGKLVSTSLGGLYALLAVLPVLALPLLLGGVTNGEFWRIVLVLLNTFFLSLSIGIFGSTFSRDARRAVAANFALLLFLMGALPLGSLYLSYLIYGQPHPGALVSCPFYSFYFCDDNRFKTHPEQFWISTCIVAAEAFLLLTVAICMVPRTWQDKPPPPVRRAKLTWGGFWRALSFGRYAKLGPYRKRLLDVNAFYWLAARARLKPLHVWIFLGLMGFWWMCGWMNAGMIWFDQITSITLALILNFTLKAWIALEAGQQLAEDQKAGALELLLATPLTVGDFLRGQLLALRRQFLKPLLLTVAIEFVLMAGDLRHGGDRTFERNLWLAGITMLVADVLTLPFVAMRVALTAKNPARATLGTIARVLALPWVLFGVIAGIGSLWVELFFPFIPTLYVPDRAAWLGLWFWIGIIIDIFFGLGAWWRLRRDFRELATRRFAPPRSTAIRKPAAGLTRSAPGFFTGRKIILAGLALVICAFFASRKTKPEFPPPLVVSITRSNVPPSVVSGTTTFITLPDGSLWRWGRTGGLGQIENRIAVPQRFGTQDDWSQIAASGYNFVGLRRDGTLWQWDSRANSMKAVGADNNWARVSAGNSHFAAIKKDGTLWAWGNNYAGQLGNGPGTNVDAPIQVGDKAGWSDVQCQGDSTLALRTNGTLWIWGQTWNQSTGINSFPTPTLFCRDSNWTRLTYGIGMWPLARNASGEVWKLALALADPSAPISEIGDLSATDSLTDRIVTAFVGKPELYELRNDGTLWEKPFSISPQFIVSPDEKWRQVGTRSDWVALWGSHTAFGLTADGTLWTWGLDPSRDTTWTFSMRLQLIQDRIHGVFGNGAGAWTTGHGPAAVIQETPRPLLRLIYSAPPALSK
jgi:ABC-type transport system involved in multi-copper enzyme maturation permease subunit